MRTVAICCRAAQSVPTGVSVAAAVGFCDVGILDGDAGVVGWLVGDALAGLRRLLPLDDVLLPFDFDDLPALPRSLDDGCERLLSARRGTSLALAGVKDTEAMTAAASRAARWTLAIIPIHLGGQTPSTL